MGQVTFLGVEGSGKTVLTMALAQVFRRHEKDGWTMVPESREAFRFQSMLPQTWTPDALPHQTTSLKYLPWSIRYNGEEQQKLDVLDYPGELYRLAFLDASDDPDPVGFNERVTAHRNEINELLSYLSQSEQIFVLFNLADAISPEANPENLDAIWVTNACLDYLHRLPSKPRITLLLTQFGRYTESPSDTPVFFMQKYLNLIIRNFPQLDVIGVESIADENSSYGINHVVARCLVRAPVLNASLTALEPETFTKTYFKKKEHFSFPDGYKKLALSIESDWMVTCRKIQNAQIFLGQNLKTVPEPRVIQDLKLLSTTLLISLNGNPNGGSFSKRPRTRLYYTYRRCKSVQVSTKVGICLQDHLVTEMVWKLEHSTDWPIALAIFGIVIGLMVIITLTLIACSF